jgi:hypothetical protein
VASIDERIDEGIGLRRGGITAHRVDATAIASTFSPRR